MRSLLVIMALMTFALPANAQSAQARHGGGGGGGHATTDTSDKQKRMNAEAKAAKAAMDKIPDSKEKYDPWKIVR